MHLSKRDYGVLESRAILILTALGWMSAEKRASLQGLISRREADFAGLILSGKPDGFRFADSTSGM